MKTYRVLIIEDKISVLNSVKDRIDYSHNVAEENYKIELLCLWAEIEGSNGNYRFTDNTIEKLFAFCQEPFDLILLDFGFVKKGIKGLDEILKHKENNPNKSIREVIDEIILNPSHLVNQVYSYPKLFKKIDKNFIGHDNAIYVYTYIPNQIEQDYTSADVRGNITNEHFPNAKIKVIDSRRELFNNNQFDSKHDADFYPFLIAKFLSNIILVEIYESVINSTKRIRLKNKRITKNKRLRNTTSILLSIFTGVLFPIIYYTIKESKYTELFISIMALCLVVAFLLIIINNLERNTSDLIK